MLQNSALECQWVVGLMVRQADRHVHELLGEGIGHEQFKEKPHSYYGREMVNEMAEFTKDSDFEKRKQYGI